MNVTKEIKKVMLEENITQETLAGILETSQANLSKKFKLNNYRTKDLEKIAEAIGYRVEIHFIKKNQ